MTLFYVGLYNAQNNFAMLCTNVFQLKSVLFKSSLSMKEVLLYFINSKIRISIQIIQYQIHLASEIKIVVNNVKCDLVYQII